LFPGTFERMLAEFRDQQPPPFCLSDAFPGDLLPMPMHITGLRLGKKLRPPVYVPAASFRRLMNGECEAPADAEAGVFRASTRIQTSIDRELGAAAEGQLFETDTEHLKEGFDALSVYIRSENYLEQVSACLRALAWTGFGKKSATGLGHFEILGAPERCDWLDHAPGANGFMALSHFVPSPEDPAEGLWRTHVTFPKFHANSVSNVFKGAIIMFTPGSVFRTDSTPPKPWYGSMIPVPRPEMPRAVHYGLCFPVPLVWPSEPQ